MDRFAPTKLPILLVGATGTGKELFAQRIHDLSGRVGPLVDVNCGALPREVIESLLFGHRRGAFTGATESALGLVEQSHRGTLFLDELLSLPLAGQATLLRVLDSGEVRPVGEGKKRQVDLRVVAAVQPEVGLRIASGELRADLYQRVAGVVIELPPLLDRMEDVLPLAECFANAQGRTLETGVAAVLTNYPWPGNIRELRVAIERAGYLVENGTLPPHAVAEAIELGGARTPVQLDQERTSNVRDGERESLREACSLCGWNADRASAALGIARSTLFRRLKAHGLSLRSPRVCRESRRVAGRSQDRVTLS
jgi:transcriptional regulator with PAS, ATPase and Fis domain